MNTALPLGHRNPRTEMVEYEYLRLAADLLTTRKQDVNYWNTVKVPVRPTDRLAFEELRQLAVFLPLVLVAFAFHYFSYVGALVATVCVVPVMAGLHKHLQRAIRNKGAAMAQRDAGRYAFTRFMCDTFDLKPEEVTMALVLKMCKDHDVWLATATDLRLRSEAAARTKPAKAGATVEFEPAVRRGLNRATGLTGAGVVAGAAATAAAVAAPVIELDAMQVNPATGLPMMDSMVDVNGNVYGTTSMDDVVHAAAMTPAVEPYGFGGGFGDSFGGDQFGGSSLGFGGFGND